MQDIISTIYFLIVKKNSTIDSWFEERFKNFKPSFYSSIDLRNSGYKIVPVDANLFPAGYNNFNERSQILASQLVRKHLSKYEKALIIPENHTRNTKYTNNLIALRNIFQLAGIETYVKKIHEETESALMFSTIKKEHNLIKTESGFIPDVIIINNDMTSGVPNILQDIKQDILPSPLLGWHSRCKSKYFEIYKNVVSEFCNEFQLDEWLISACTTSCKDINFTENHGLEVVATAVDAIVSEIRNKFQIYNIKEQPYVFIKASKGTYGMGIITAASGEDILQINKKKRNKMSKIKEGIKVDSVVIQEGVGTIDYFNNSTAEPLVYYIEDQPTCYLYRYNQKKDRYSNLNSLGCDFTDVSMAMRKETLLVWSLISKLAVLATAKESLGHDLPNYGK